MDEYCICGHTRSIHAIDLEGISTHCMNCGKAECPKFQYDEVYEKEEPMPQNEDEFEELFKED